MNIYKFHNNPEKLNLASELLGKIGRTGALEFRDSNDLLHRDGDLPALINARGTMFWAKNGNIHRDGDKPAVIHKDGSLEYYKEGELHRGGGKPAIINSNGEQEWWEYGNFIRKHIPINK